MSTQARVANMIRTGARRGGGRVQSLAGSRIVKDLGTRVSLRGCSCDIPPPCWLPRSLGEVRSFVCAGGTASVRIRVTNCGASQRTVQLEAAGDAGGDVTVTPQTLTLGPMERAVATASLALPTGAASGHQREALLWVRGCHDHYVRWTVNADGASQSVHEVDVEDCPDVIHHWYDHFYCEHPCPGRG
jgi:hypothetical protein